MQKIILSLVTSCSIDASTCFMLVLPMKLQSCVGSSDILESYFSMFYPQQKEMDVGSSSSLQVKTIIAARFTEVMHYVT